MVEIGDWQSYQDQGCLKWASFRAISGNCADHGELQGLAAAPAGALPRSRARAGLGARGRGAGRAGWPWGQPGLPEAQLAREGAPGIETRPFTG